MDILALYPSLPKLWADCNTFINELCRDRDASAHGPHHCRRVVENSIQILSQGNYSEMFWKTTIVVAFIHDVLDHKYPDPSGKVEKSLDTFLKTLSLVGDLGKDLSPSLKLIASYVSWRKENEALIAGAPLDYDKLLNTANMPYAREEWEIVNDSDKLDAIGEEGMPRLLHHTKHEFLKRNGREPTDDEMHHVVNHHSEAKLLHLKDKFIRTPHGKVMAVKAHEEFVNALAKFNGSE